MSHSGPTPTVPEGQVALVSAGWVAVFLSSPTAFQTDLVRLDFASQHSSRAFLHVESGPCGAVLRSFVQQKARPPLSLRWNIFRGTPRLKAGWLRT